MLRSTPLHTKPAIVKKMPTYPKSCATNTIAWHRLQYESLIDPCTVWNRNVAYNLSREICKKLETIFEQQKAIVKTNKFEPTNEKSPKTTVLSNKRAFNLAIVLARFRPLTYTQIVAALVNDHKIAQLTVENIDLLLRHYPTDEEMIKCSQIDADHLRYEELFCNLVARETNLKLKLELITFQNEFDTTSHRIRLSLDTLRTAIDALLESDAFALFLHQCLHFGNFLNQGSYAGRTGGFRIDSLYELLNTKGRNNIRVVDVLAEFSDGSVSPVDHLVDPMAAALKCPKEHVEVQLQELQHSIDSYTKRLLNCNDMVLREKYDKFLSTAESCCIELMTDAEAIFAKEQKLSEYLCTEQMSLIDIFTAVHTALLLFREALKAHNHKHQSKIARFGAKTRITI